ncbi:hypothetical protein GE107_19630 [Cohnella sp. CFH 77786]|uniref:lyase family protein n=1 Tax=Cohnella sp. CFH 77786 TaxID=2662265 RepID=UPI001C6099A5|nr:lyase family protein [Cohnella sp. CFH 77786]MBW5448261.1 hypothetical protein [Cohnella sp. CFH 77786]
MDTVRIERWEFGEEAVPAHAYYGIRTKHAQRRLTDTGKDYKHDLLAALALLKKTAARTETESGRLEARVGALIERAAQEVADGRWHEQFVFEPSRCGSGPLLSLNMNEVLANRAMELMGEVKGSYHIVSPDWHAESPLHPNRYFSAAFQLAAIEYVRTIHRQAEALPPGIAGKISPVLTSLEERLRTLNGEHFDAGFISRLGAAAGLPLHAGILARQAYETAYGQISSTMNAAISELEPAIRRIDSVELKAGIIQISAFRDMIAFMDRSGFSAQGMEEVTAYYAWQCMDLFYRALLKINQIYH